MEALEFDVEKFIESAIVQHKTLLGDRLSRLRDISIETAGGNPDNPELATMDQKVAYFCNDLRECCSREQNMVFPAILRLKGQTQISQCHAGMMKARLKFMTAEHEAVLAALAEISEIATNHLSPKGPCESCHEMLKALKAYGPLLRMHFAREQDELFVWALRREQELVAKNTAAEC